MRRLLLYNLLVLIGTQFLVFAVGEIAVGRLAAKPPMEVVGQFSGSEAKAGRNVTLDSSPPDSLFQYTPQGGVRLTPNTHISIKNHYLSHRDIEININSLGFRAPELNPSKNGEKRFLVLGDSITMGDYVSADETYPGRMEFYLKKKDPSIRVINAGIGAADIKNEYQTLLDPGLRVEPDVVVIGLYLNDGELSANLIVKPLPGILKKSYFLNYLYRRVKIISYRWEHRQELAGSNRKWLQTFIRGRNLEEEDWKKSRDGFDYLIVKNVRDWGAAWDPQTWQVIHDKMVEIQKLADVYHFKLFVVLFPVRYQVEADYLYDYPQQEFKRLMDELEIPNLDLLTVMRGVWQANRQAIFYYDKCHMTPLANDLVAQKISEALSDSSR